MDPDAARQVADAWLDAWNRHDLAAVLAHYPDWFEFRSPLVVERLGRADGVIRDKAELARYFAGSLQPGSDLRFELIDVFAGVDSVTILYRNHRDQIVSEFMVLNGDGHAVRVDVHRRIAATA